MKDHAMSHPRSNYAAFRQQAPDIHEAVLGLSQLAAKAGLDKQLLELVKIRASQINGCAFCFQHHILLAEKLGISADKLHLLAVWRADPQFSERERAALAWPEALTVLEDGISDEVFAQARAQFSESELLYLPSAIGVIIVCNRCGAAYRWTPATRPNGVAASAS
jgi:AhpD family alkylhydroperoxidase